MHRPSIYYAESGLLAVGNLMSRMQWIRDKDRTHCCVCIQQFYAFKRRHHCRTCGEVVCSRCSNHRRLRLVDENIDLTARICIVCVTEATNATREVSITLERLTLLDDLNTPSAYYHMQMDSRFDEPVSSMDTTRLEAARCADTQHPNKDDTLKLLVHLVSRSLQCPMILLALLGSTGELHVHESFGLNVGQSCLVEMCVPVLKNQSTVIIPNSHRDSNLTAKLMNARVVYYAGTPVVLHGKVIGVLAAMDTVEHANTNIVQRNTLESIARIAAEIFEQRGLDSKELGSGSNCYVPTNSTLSQHRKTIMGILPNTESCREPSSNQDDTYYSGAIESILQLYRILHGCSWENAKLIFPHRQFGHIQFFAFHERYQHGYIKAVTKISFPSLMLWHEVLDIRQPIYSNCLIRVGNRQLIDDHTNLDQVVFQPGCSWARTKQYPLLTHWREFSGGASIHLGMQLREDCVPEFCFGWMISPILEENGDFTAIISVIVPQHKEMEEANIIGDWLLRLQKAIHPNRHQRAQSFSIHDKHNGSSRSSRSNTLDSRPQTEAFFWSLLEQTMSTQRVLSQRQMDMLQVLEHNGSRLADLSQAVARVEFKLHQPHLHRSTTS